LLDRHAYALNLEMRDGLGAWIQTRLRKGIEKQGKVAAAELVPCGVTVTELRRQWELQQEAQLSVRARESSRNSYQRQQVNTPFCLQMLPRVSKRNLTKFLASKVISRSSRRSSRQPAPPSITARPHQQHLPHYKALRNHMPNFWSTSRASMRHSTSMTPSRNFTA